MVPESVAFLERVGSKHYGPLFAAQGQLRVPGVAETQCLLGLLSAVLERNCPTRESTFGYSTISRASSRRSSICSAISFTQSHSGSRVSSAAVSRSPSHVSMVDFVADGDSGSEGPPSDVDLPFVLSTISLAQLQVLSILSFSFIWSIGAFVPFRWAVGVGQRVVHCVSVFHQEVFTCTSPMHSEVASFEEFAREQIRDMPFSVSLPDEGSVFDYYLDLKTYQFLPWSTRKTKDDKKISGFVATSELTRLSYVVDLYLSYNHNVMLVGEQGTGKTAFVEVYIMFHLE